MELELKISEILSNLSVHPGRTRAWNFTGKKAKQVYPNPKSQQGRLRPEGGIEGKQIFNNLKNPAPEIDIVNHKTGCIKIYLIEKPWKLNPFHTLIIIRSKQFLNHRNLKCLMKLEEKNSVTLEPLWRLHSYNALHVFCSSSHLRQRGSKQCA